MLVAMFVAAELALHDHVFEVVEMVITNGPKPATRESMGHSTAIIVVSGPGTWHGGNLG